MWALVRMSLWQIRNAARSGLRNPAVWLPVLVLALLIPTRFSGMLTSQTPFPPETGRFLRGHLEAIHATVFLLLALLALGYVDAGLSGGALRFTSPDVALLFPAPLSRRLVLLFKLPSALSQHLLMIVFLAGAFRMFVWLPMQQGRTESGWPAFLATALCVVGFLNVSATLDLFSGAGRYDRVKIGFRLAVIALIVGFAWFVWTRGMDGLLAIGNNAFLLLLFSPCWATADAVIAPFRNVQLSGLSWVVLFGWYGLTLLLLFTRRVNYYEAAAAGAERVERMRLALRSGNWAAMRGQPASAGRVFIPPFGRGSGALFWAHLAAAAKRPIVNFVLPFFGGLGLALALALTTAHLIGSGPEAAEETASGVKFGLLMATGYYVLYAVVILSPQFYQRSLARETLIRPLPLSIGLIVGADVGTRSLLGLLFPVGEGLGLLIVHPAGTGALSLTLLFSAVALIVFVNVLGYRLALAYPNGTDKFQMWAASLVQLSVWGLLSLAITPFWAVPIALHAPEWVALLSVTVGILLAYRISVSADCARGGGLRVLGRNPTAHTPTVGLGI